MPEVTTPQLTTPSGYIFQIGTGANQAQLVLDIIERNDGSSLPEEVMGLLAMGVAAATYVAEGIRVLGLPAITVEQIPLHRAMTRFEPWLRKLSPDLPPLYERACRATQALANLRGAVREHRIPSPVDIACAREFLKGVVEAYSHVMWS